MTWRSSATSRFSRTDWRGDAVVVIVLGLLLLGTLWLPWANDPEYPKQNFTYALATPDDIKPILETPWGWPIAVAGGLVVALGLTMLIAGPRRWTGGPIALALTVIAVWVLYDVDQAVRPAWGWGYAVGLGVLIAVIVAILLPIVALATALTARIVRDQEAQAARAAAGDAAETAATPAA